MRSSETESLADLAWRVSSRCAGGNCVQIATSGGKVFIRDSKDPNGPILDFPLDSWRNFVVDAKRGIYDITA
ncbi:DUF397 domain-containing protein [Thermostaphylospora chromogena]|uniref:DUF397 domain-containing protein n=1 Tax=Thermostaphylospora chromogena TaxID=35622 RepID=A0A1H1EXI2_9ACTN|nr:DUF397 domain-containing protein [Thermostaphylospora chromogena]SDQ93259.1 protein of unknown function [Thermostaphylospora chromogena]